MALFDIFHASEIKKENERLTKILQDMGAADAVEVKKRIEALKSEEEQYINEFNKLKTQLTTQKNQLSDEITKLNIEINDKKNQLISIDEGLMLESFALYTPHYTFLNSSEYKQRLDEVRSNQKNLIKLGVAASCSQTWTVNNSKTEGKKMTHDMIKLVIRSFNNECDYCVDTVKFNNIESNEKRINSSFDALNKLGQIMHVSISQEYKKLKFDELYLAYEYQKKKQEEKEEQRRLREEMREQEKLEQEIKIARERIAKDKKHFSKAIEDIKNRLAKVTNEVELQDLNLKISELQSQYSELEKEEKQIDYREQNAKAGYVYVISNLGSFGENVYKIGMTRRLEPLDRIHELGDASVPFPFDIHALIFSENAPELEAKIQNHFYQRRLNKINNRKEFFKADINELEGIIKSNYNKVVDFNKYYEAEQYRESLLIKN